MLHTPGLGKTLYYYDFAFCLWIFSSKVKVLPTGGMLLVDFSCFCLANIRNIEKQGTLSDFSSILPIIILYHKLTHITC